MALTAESFGRPLSADEQAYYQPMFDQAAAAEKYQQGMGVQAATSSPYDFGNNLASQSQNGGGGGGGYGAARPSGAQSANTGYGSSSTSGNPYLQQYGDALTQQSVQQFNQGVLPQIRSGAQAAGQYGSSRQGIAEGVAAGNASTGLGANLANLYSQGYNTNQNYNLGLGGLALQNQSMNNNFYTTNRQLDQSGAALGNTLYNSGVDGQLKLGNAQYQAGNTFQNAPMNTLSQYSNMVNPYTGLNQSNTGTNSQGGGANGAIGGGLTVAMLLKQLGYT